MPERTETLTAASAPRSLHDGSYMDWPAVFAGGVVASAIAFVFTTFGTGIGLTLASPYEGEGSALASLLAIGSWMIWTVVSSFMAGGYIAGRMRRRIDSANADEVGIRDGIHGLTVWGVGVLVGAVILAAGIGQATDVASRAEGPIAETAAAAMDTVTEDKSSAASDEPGTTTAPTPRDDRAEADRAPTKAQAEEARKYGIVAAFVVAASLFIAAAAAYWAASLGGRHRDEGRATARFGRWT